jgi:YlqD protein
METSNLMIQRQVNIKAIVTPRWKEDMQQALQGQLNQVDGQLQGLDLQLQQVLTDMQKQSIQPPGPDTLQQMEGVKMQFNQAKSELLEQKNQVLQQLQQVQTLSIDQEVDQGNVVSTFKVQVGDNLISKVNTVELLIRDGIVEEIRGDV